MTSPFAVPLRWFALFAQDERVIAEEDGRMVVRYRTALATGLERVRRSVQVLEDAGFDDAIVEQVGDVVRWLEEFPRDGLIELDYGGVVDLFHETDLVLDESAAEIAASIEALALVHESASAPTLASARDLDQSWRSRERRHGRTEVEPSQP